MQRIFLSALVIGGVIGAAIYGTSSFFSDTETSTGNTFTAGSVTIAIQNIAHHFLGDPGAQFSTHNNGISFALADLKPLDNGTVTYDLLNGANEAHVCVMVTETGNHENGRNDPELQAGDITSGAGNGELGQFLSFKFGSQSGALETISGLWQSLSDNPIAANTPANSSIEYCFGEYDGEGDCILDDEAEYNLAQTDSLTADISFYAVQARNNADFDCSSLNQIEEESGKDFGTLSTGTAYQGWANGHNGAGNAGSIDFTTLGLNWSDFSVSRSVDGDGDVTFVVNTPKTLTETSDFFAVVLDYDNDLVQDAQVVIYNGVFSYREFDILNPGDGWAANTALPAGITATPSGVADEYTITVDSSYFTGSSYAFAVQLWLGDNGHGTTGNVVNSVLPTAATNSVWHPVGSGNSSDFQVDTF